MISIIILAIVFVLIAVRQIGNIKLQIWQIMLGGAIAVLVTKQISFSDAFSAINFDVILFLFGMFIVGEALEKSGYLAHLSYNFFKNTKSVNALLLFVILGMGIVSMFLMNDTVAIIGTPVVLILSDKNKIPPKLMLLALAFAVTTGSVMSPIGNPQNLLIAVNGNLNNSFITFSKYLFVPTIINLLLAFILLKIFYKNEIHTEIINHIPETIVDKKLSGLSKISLGIIIALIIVKIVFIFLNIPFNFRLTYIAVAAALPIILFSSKRIEIVKHVDWHTIIFFAAMFILMQSVWNSGFFQNLIRDSNLNLTSVFMILTVSVLLSQLISNVPLVALYLPMLIHLGITSKEMMALAAGSTVAGNLFILGAASNIIIIQNAEKRGGKTITFLEFAKVGIPLTILNVFTYYFYFKLF
jgi:Na+/H+ antiporter NhaD/arsenite permease-like protein